MKIATILSAAALVVALGFTTAQAQEAGGIEPGGAPAAGPSGGLGDQGGGAGGAPDMGPRAGGTEDLGGPGLTGPKGDQPGMSAEGGMQGKGKTGAAAQDKAATETEGKAGGKGKAGAKAEGEAEGEGKAGTQAEGKGDMETGTKAEGDIGAEGKAGATAEGQKSGKGGKSVRLESQQVSKVKSYFSEHRPTAKSIDKTEVSVSVGIALPGTIALYDLPPDVIVVSGACPVKYFVWGEDVVLVDSCTREVVEIIVGVA